MSVLAKVTRGIVRGLVDEELQKLPRELVRSWLNPCSRLAWAEFWAARRIRLGHPVRAAFWTARTIALKSECIELRGAGTCAADVAKRAAVLAESLTVQ